MKNERKKIKEVTRGRWAWEEREGDIGVGGLRVDLVF